MNEAFLGDIGDFGKLGLLWELHRHAGNDGVPRPFRVGIAWWPTTRRNLELATRPRKFLVDHGDLETCDRRLYPALRKLNRRLLASPGRAEWWPSFGSIERLLPDGTRFCALAVPDRPALRSRYARLVLGELGDCNVVVADPDDGIGAARVGETASTRVVAVEEVRTLWANGLRSVIVYDHFDRRPGGATARMAERLGWFQNMMPNARVLVLRFRRCVARHFYILPACSIADWLVRTIQQLAADSPWGAAGCGVFRTAHFGIDHVDS